MLSKYHTVSGLSTVSSHGVLFSGTEIGEVRCPLAMNPGEVGYGCDAATRVALRSSATSFANARSATGTSAGIASTKTNAVISAGGQPGMRAPKRLGLRRRWPALYHPITAEGTDLRWRVAHFHEKDVGVLTERRGRRANVPRGGAERQRKPE